MSLILEALKKSEAKRRLGETPDLATPFATAPRRRSAAPALFVAIVVAAGAGWWLLRAPPAKEPPASTPTAAPEHRASVAAPPAATSVQAPAPRPAATAPKPEPAPPPEMPPREFDPFVGQGSVDMDPRFGPHPAGRSTRPPTVVASKPAPAAAAKPALTANPAGQKPLPPTTPAADGAAAGKPTVTAAVTGSQKAFPAPSESEGATAGKPAAPTPGAGSQKAFPPPPEGAQQADANAQPYYALPFQVRKELPPLKLSMHVYTPEANQRFIILNSSRMVEGDTQDDLAVREIRPDGVVFEFHGQRFFYPRDGS